MPASPQGDLQVSVLVHVGKAATTGLDWTAISAVATGFAAVVALLVGVLPVWIDRTAKKRQAIALAKVLADDLAIQAITIRAVLEVPTSGVADAWEYDQMTKSLSVLSSAQARELIPFSQYLPRNVENEVTKGVALLSAAEKRRVHLFTPEPGQRYNVEGDLSWYREVADGLSNLRQALATWLNLELVAIEEPGMNLGKGLKENAGADRTDWQGAKRLAHIASKYE